MLMYINWKRMSMLALEPLTNFHLLIVNIMGSDSNDKIIRIHKLACSMFELLTNYARIKHLTFSLKAAHVDTLINNDSKITLTFN